MITPEEILVELDILRRMIKETDDQFDERLTQMETRFDELLDRFSNT